MRKSLFTEKPIVGILKEAAVPTVGSTNIETGGAKCPKV